MNKVILLTMVFFKSSLQKISDKTNFTKRKNKGIVKKAYIMLILYMLIVVGILSYSTIDTLKSVNQETIFIGLIFLLVFIVSSIQTVFSGINLLYFSKDNASVLPLPLKPYQIILARTNIILIAEYIIGILIGFIPLTIYGIMLNCGIIYYVTMIIALILLPILPIIVVSLLIMVIMSFSKITKNKNRFQLIATLIVLALTIVSSIYVSKMETETLNDEIVAQMMVEANSMVNLVKDYFPTLEYAITAVTSNDILTAAIQFIKITLITILAFIIYILLSQKIYFKGLIGNLYSSSKSKKNTKIKIDTKNHSISRKYIAKEFKLLIRNTVYLVQCVLPAILFPIIVIIMIFSSIDQETLGQLYSILNISNEDTETILFVVLMIIQLFSMIIYISVTAISREGENAVFMKYIPLSLYKQYVYKSVPNIIMNTISTIIVLVVAKILVGLTVIDMVILLIISIIMSIFSSLLSIIIDLKRPKLKWNSENAVVKQNINLIFPLIFSLVNIGIIILVNALFVDYSLNVQLAMLTSIYIIGNIVINIYLYKNQYKLANKIY